MSNYEDEEVEILVSRVAAMLCRHKAVGLSHFELLQEWDKIREPICTYMVIKNKIK